MENTERIQPAQLKCHSFEAKLGPVRIFLNPVVTILSGLIIWSVVIVCLTVASDSRGVDYRDALMTSVKGWISTTLTWFYIGTRNVWVIFVFYIFFSKYGKIKLGKDDEEPEFSDMTYFTKLFAASFGIGLFYFGVGEPVIHYDSNDTHVPYANRYWARYTDKLRFQDAMNITLFHWGFHVWVVYVLVGLLLAYIGHRHRRPMTIRFCFYPLIGDKVYGVAGDLIDTLSVVVTMFGVCTSFILGLQTFVGGLISLSSSIDGDDQTTRTIIICAVIVMATAFFVFGLKFGIRRYSEICFGLGMFIMLFVFFRGNTWYFLNVYVQGIGYYLQYAIELSFHTEAYAQEGNARNGKENPNWIGNWTIFYWGWWISWSPYVGMFIAKISRGRTIRNYLMCTMTAPILYTFLWFSIFGSAGLNMEREAALAGIDCSSKLGGKYATYSKHGMFRLSCRNSAQMFFDVMQSYNDNLTPYLHLISMTSITLYFLTSLHGSSLVIHCLSANGSHNLPIIQRVFWAVTEGACVTGLVFAESADGLTALQTVSVVAGLPYTVIVCFMCVALWKALTSEENSDRKSPGFLTSLFHVFTFPLSLQKLLYLIVAIAVPWFPAGRASAKVSGKKMYVPMVTMAVLFNTFIILIILQKVETDIAYIGWVVLMGHFGYVTGIRAEVRQAFKIEGNIFQDFLVVMFLHPFAVDQLDRQMLYERSIDNTNDGAEMQDLERNGMDIEEGEEEAFINRS